MQLDVTRYVWVSIYSGVGLSLCLIVIQYFQKKEVEHSPGLRRVGLIPVGIIRTFVDWLLGFWVRCTINFGLLSRWRQVLFALSLAALPTGHLWIRHVPYFDLRLLLHALALTPIVGFASGVVIKLTRPFIPSIIKNLKNESLGFMLGYLSTGPFFLNEKNLSYHVELIAPTGSGKSNLLQNLILNRISLGHGIIFMDFKGDFDLVSWAFRAAGSVDREEDFRLVSLANEELAVPYNPVKFGSPSEIHSQIMNSIPWSEEFYRNVSSVALLTLIHALCEYRDKTGALFHLGHVLALLESAPALENFLSKLTIEKCNSADRVEQLAGELSRPQEKDRLKGLMAGLTMLVRSAAGNLLTRDAEKGSFDLNEAVEKQRITYFLMNSLKLRESAKVIGKLLLQDLMRFVGDRYSQIEPRQRRPVTVIIDEFANFAMPDFIDFMDRARGAGIGIIIAHQSRADLRHISPEFQERIEANANTTLVSGVKSSDDADYYAGIIGTQTTNKETVQKVRDMLFFETETGVKAVREAEEYILHPNSIKSLQQGQLLAITNTVDRRWGLVKVPKAPEYSKNFSMDQMLQSLKNIREGYARNGTDRYLSLIVTDCADTKPVNCEGVGKGKRDWGAQL